MATWPVRRWWVAVATTVLSVLVTAVPTAMTPTPYFHRDVPTPSWAWPVLLVTSGLVGLVAATYVARADEGEGGESGSRLGALGALTTFFAVGCPVCNKLVLLALGYTGALQYFAPVQPLLAATAIAVLVWALLTRLRTERACTV